jgi:hypothetical protein
MNAIEKYIYEGKVLAINLENELVFGQIVKDDFANSGIAFKSVFCPQFIIEENLRHPEDNLTGYYCEITQVEIDYDKIYILFDDEDELIRTYYRLNELSTVSDLVAMTFLNLIK